MTHNIEVVDWEEHPNDAIEVISQKCQEAYPAHFSLLVPARNGKVIELERVIQELQRVRVPFANIWILGRESGSFFKVVRIYSTFCPIDVNVIRCLAKTPATTDFLVRQKRGKSTAVRDLGLIYLPIP